MKKIIALLHSGETKYRYNHILLLQATKMSDFPHQVRQYNVQENVNWTETSEQHFFFKEKMQSDINFFLILIISTIGPVGTWHVFDWQEESSSDWRTGKQTTDGQRFSLDLEYVTRLVYTLNNWPKNLHKDLQGYAIDRDYWRPLLNQWILQT